MNKQIDCAHLITDNEMGVPWYKPNVTYKCNLLKETKFIFFKVNIDCIAKQDKYCNFYTPDVHKDK